MERQRISLISIGLLILAGSFSSELSGQTVRATKASERTVGSDKICTYEYNSVQVGTRTVTQYQLCPYSITVQRPGSGYPQEAMVTARFDRENITGQTKTCIYRYRSNEYSQTVGRRDRCPRQIRVRRNN
jgi:hypothetical protein